MNREYITHLIRLVLRKIQRTFYRLRQERRLRRMELTGQFLDGRNTIICFAHPRTATQSIGKIFEIVCGRLNLNCFWGYLPLNQQTLQNLIARYQIIFLHRTQPGDFPAQFNQIDFKGFHIYRDPRNLLVSLYFAHRYSHKLDRYTADIQHDRAFLQAHSEEEGLIYLLHHSKQFNEAIASLKEWNFKDPRLLEIKFEDYADNIEAAWIRILNFTGISIPRDCLMAILSDFSLESLRLISVKRSGYSHYRSAKPDDYQQYFTPKLKDEFNKKAGNLLIELGYETSLRW